MRDILWNVLSPLLWWVIMWASMPGMITSALPESFKKSGENWRLSGAARMLYDTNVVQDPDKGPELIADQDAAGFNWTAAAAYAFVPTERFNLRFDYDIDMTVYLELGDYDLTAQMFGVKPKYVLSDHSFVDLQYFFIYNLAGYDAFSGINYIGPTYTRISRKWGVTRLNFYYSDNNYYTDQQRDADEIGGGITHEFSFDNGTKALNVGFQISDEDSVGRFGRQVYNVQASGAAGLPWGVQLQPMYQYSFRNYDTFASSTAGRTREDDQHRIRLEFIKRLSGGGEWMRYLKARFSWDFTKNSSNLDARDYTSNRFGMNVSGEF